MPMYIVLGKLTDQGAKDLPDFRRIAERSMAGGERMGAKTHGFYITQGSYDFVIVVEAPDAETMLAGTAAAAGGGSGHSETLRAFTIDEFEKTLKKLPAA